MLNKLITILCITGITAYASLEASQEAATRQDEYGTTWTMAGIAQADPEIDGMLIEAIENTKSQEDLVAVVKGLDLSDAVTLALSKRQSEFTFEKLRNVTNGEEQAQLRRIILLTLLQARSMCDKLQQAEPTWLKEAIQKITALMPDSNESVSTEGKASQTTTTQSESVENKSNASTQASSTSTTTTTSSSNNELSCAACGRSDTKLKSCPHCKKVNYCRKKCRRNHWSTHKQECKQEQKGKTS